MEEVKIPKRIQKDIINALNNTFHSRFGHRVDGYIHPYNTAWSISESDVHDISSYVEEIEPFMRKLLKEAALKEIEDINQFIDDGEYAKNATAQLEKYIKERKKYLDNRKKELARLKERAAAGRKRVAEIEKTRKDLLASMTPAQRKLYKKLGNSI